jgi:hypothetical protein
MEHKPLSGLWWRIALWVAFLLLFLAVVYTLAMLSQPFTIG